MRREHGPGKREDKLEREDKLVVIPEARRVPADYIEGPLGVLRRSARVHYGTKISARPS